MYNPTECYETDGIRFGSPVYCPFNAYGDCPYCDQENKCHIKDPIADCSDFAMFFESWDEWLRYDEYQPRCDDDDCNDEIGYNPYEGAYDYDC